MAGPALESPAGSLLEDRHHWLRYEGRPTAGRRLRILRDRHLGSQWCWKARRVPDVHEPSGCIATPTSSAPACRSSRSDSKWSAVRTSVQEKVSMSSGRLAGLVGMGANDRMRVRCRRAHRPPGNINPSFGPNPRRQTSRIQPLAQISPNHFHPFHLRTSSPIRCYHDTAATAKQARRPRPRRGGGLFVRGREHLFRQPDR
jgi:hypothetical protein